MVKSLIHLPYSLLLIPVVIFLGLFFSGVPFDMHMYDTVFKFHLFNIELTTYGGHLIFDIILLCFPFWLIYLAARKFMLSSYLSWFHVLVSVAAAMNCIWICIWVSSPSFGNYHYLPGISELLATLPSLFLLAQLAFLVNLIGGLIKKIFQYTSGSPQQYH